MLEQRRQYRILNPSNLGDLANQVNRLLGNIGDRFDQLEGYRGTPTFKANLDVGANRVTNAADAVASSDLATKSQVVDLPGAEVWPIGSVFIANLSTSPATLMGFGTWAVIGTGQLHIGTGTHGAGIVGSYDGGDVENIQEPRSLIYIWQRTA